MVDRVTLAQMGAGRTMRPATPADIKQIRALICEAIDESPFYNAQFKAHEKVRLNEDFLLALISADPWFVPVILYKGEFAGFIVSTPELGVLWAVWVYISPRFRQTAIALTSIGFLVRHWDNGRFHKISCFVRPENTRSEAVMTHFGFERTALLRNHIFGQDYLLLERPLNKTRDGYDPPLAFGRINALRRKLRHVLSRAR